MLETIKILSGRAIIALSVGLLIILSLIFLPHTFTAKADRKITEQTVAYNPELPYYDIRADKDIVAVELLQSFRGQANLNAVEIADFRQNFIVGESALRLKVPTLVTEYNADLKIPEVITPDVKQRAAFLTVPSTEKRADILRNFIKQNNDLLGVTDQQINALETTQDYTNPNGDLSFATLEQFINGVPVFRGEVKAGFNRRGEMIRVINNLAPNLEYTNLSTDFGNPTDAVTSAAKYINHDLKAGETTVNIVASTDLKTVFGTGDWATTVEKMYFPTDLGVARAAWRVLIWQPTNAFYVIIDAETGKMLWRKNIAEDQTQAVTYNVYANPGSIINTADSPAPGTPGPISPLLGTQYPIIPRTNITLIGNEPPYTFNNTGWIPDGETTTVGNAVEAGLDIDGTNGVDPNGRATATNRTFNFAYTPGDMNGTGDAPTLPAYRNGAVTQLFYVCNRYHDEMYNLGFTEAARNFQNTNYTAQGIGNDRVSAEAQDSSGTNNANFATPADGVNGRMQMYVFTAPIPNRDGDLDADIVIHEHTHGLSNRLHGNSTGLGSTMSRGMGEGWSDFYAHAMLSEPSDPINGIYTTGAYSTLNFRTAAPFSSLGNYYYGIRAFPKAVMAFTGGPDNRPHNPYTFKDIETPTLTDGAFPPAFNPSPTSTHYLGEVWSSALWEVRAKMITRLGFAGNRRILQLVTDGMKLAPLSPNFIQERDAILAAARASSIAPENSADVRDIWSGFAIRGMGFGAAYTSATSVIEAFDSPNLVQSPTFSFTDTTGNNNGFADPGETIMLSIPVVNTTGDTAVNASLTVAGGGIANYGTIADGQTVTRQIPFTVPFTQNCGTAIPLTFNIFSSLGTRSNTRLLSVGQGQGATETFDASAALPAGWTTALTGTGSGWSVSTALPATLPHAIFANDSATVGSSTVETGLTTFNAQAAKVKFKINYNTESGWDGTVLEIKIGAGAYQDIIAGGGTFIAGGYNSAINPGSFPNAGRDAWAGNSNGYIDVEAILPAAANGQTVQFRFISGSDTSQGGVGTFIDNFRLENTFACSAIAARSRADFDGDGKTDLSVFRPSEGNWYLNRSTAGFAAINWGIATDVLTPGDFDGDNKADFAVFRATAADGQPDFYILRSGNFTVTGAAWGTTGDVPVIGDYDGDNKADMSVYRPSSNVWFILKSGGGAQFTTFGLAGEIPVAGDFDGDGKADLTVFREGIWRSQLSGGGTATTNFGLPTDKLVPADYDGDNKDDIAVYRPSNGVWYLRLSGSGIVAITFGISTDVPVPGDYDGDGKDDIAVYRNGIWYLNQSTSGVAILSFGLTNDKPLPKQYIP